LLALLLELPLSGPVPLGAVCHAATLLASSGRAVMGDAGGELVGEAMGREKFLLRLLSLRSSSSATSDNRLELRFDPGGLVGGG
jgi:hypothetical protein